MLAVIGELPGFVAVKEEIFPVPLAARPMLALLLVQLYEVAVPVKLIAVVVSLLHTVWLPGSFTVGMGLIVIVAAFDGA